MSRKDRKLEALALVQEWAWCSQLGLEYYPSQELH